MPSGRLLCQADTGLNNIRLDDERILVNDPSWASSPPAH
jgi:hypothetical protein